MDIHTLCINTIRCLAADMVEKAKSGHAGMGFAPTLHVLFSKFLQFSSTNPKWQNRDRLILSNGHGCALQYILLHLTGYPLTMDDLKQFRQLNSKTPGHPENVLTEGIEVTTGPLGQGFANGVGMAIALEHTKTRFNQKDFELYNHYIYVTCGDGDLMEGITSEASSLAGHLGLGSLIVLYDDNKVTIDGRTDITFTENVKMRYEAYGWHVQTVGDGNNDLDSIERAIENARNVKDKPSFILIRTIIGYGSQNQGKAVIHGAPLGSDDIKKMKKVFGFDPEKDFFVDEKVYEYYHNISKERKMIEQDWKEQLEDYKKLFPEKEKEFEKFRNDSQYEYENYPKYTSKDKPLATRKLSQIMLNFVANINPNIIGGSADLAESTKTDVESFKEFNCGSYDGRTIRFGVREHSMAAIANGIRAYANYIPYVSTFLNFTSYLLPALRLSSLSHFQVIYIMTHDSIGLGEDGPTHQPIEILPLLRAIPNLNIMRPCDGNEVSGAYLVALSSKGTPTVICLSRQDLPQLEGSDAEKVSRGAYIIHEPKEKPKVIFISTGSEVAICIEAAKNLGNARVISMPSSNLFDVQSEDYQKNILLEDVPKISLEASSTFGWSKYSNYQIGINSFGKSAPYKKLYEYFDFTSDKLIQVATRLIK